MLTRLTASIKRSRCCVCTIAAVEEKALCLRSGIPRTSRRRLNCTSQAQQPLNELNAGPGSLQHVEDNGKVLEEWIGSGPQLQLMEQAAVLGPQQLTIVVPRSSDAVMDMYIDAERWDRDPYWCRPWPSALALGRLLLQEPHLVRGKRVCEIGCGLGIAGIAAALAGASQVVLTDREELALECALKTAQASGVAATNCGWLSSNPSAQLAAANLDWNREDTGLGTFDVVLACDVLYERPAVEPVAALIPKLLNASSTSTFILADPEARTRAHRQDFVQLIRSHRWLPMSVQGTERVEVEMDGLDTVVQLVVFSADVSQGTVGVKFL